MFWTVCWTKADESIMKITVSCSYTQMYLQHHKKGANPPIFLINYWVINRHFSTSLETMWLSGTVVFLAILIEGNCHYGLSAACQSAVFPFIYLFIFHVSHGSRVQPFSLSYFWGRCNWNINRCPSVTWKYANIHIYISHYFQSLFAGRERIGLSVWRRKERKAVLSQHHLFCVGSLLPVSSDVLLGPFGPNKTHFWIISDSKKKQLPSAKEIPQSWWGR